MDRQIVISDRPVHYTVDGNPADNPRGTVVLMHGWGCSTTTLASVEAVARQCGYATVSIDFPGHGQSPEPTSVWGVEEYTAVLEAIVAEERIDRPVLLGHSFGGRLGILYASRHPDGVSKLILVDAAGIKPRRSLRYYWKVYTFKAAKRLMYLVYGRENAEKRLDRIRARNGSSDYASASPRMRASANAPSGSAGKRWALLYQANICSHSTREPSSLCQ